MRVSRSRASSRRFARYAARARASSSANDDASEDDTGGDGRFVEAVASPAGMSRLDEHAVEHLRQWPRHREEHKPDQEDELDRLGAGGEAVARTDGLRDDLAENQNEARRE